MVNQGVVYAGTSGLVLPITKANFPAAFSNASRLSYYASLYNSIEINSSFYKMPRAATVQKWADEVPAGFRFTYKLFKNISHLRGLEFDPAEVSQFIQSISPAGIKKGSLLIQFPPKITMEKMGQLETLLKIIEETNRDHRWQIAIEFRHTSWYNAEVYTLLNSYNAAMVVHDLPASATPLGNVSTAFEYVRFHGPGGRYRGSYDTPLLQHYASYINEKRREGKTVYVYFNNTMGDALGNLNTLLGLLEK